MHRSPSFCVLWMFSILSCFWRYFWSAITFLIKRSSGIQHEEPRCDWNQEEHIRKLLFVFFFVHRSQHPWICGRCVMDTGGVCFLPIGTQTIKLTNRLSSTAISSCITWIPVAPVFLTRWRNRVQCIDALVTVFCRTLKSSFGELTQK